MEYHTRTLGNSQSPKNYHQEIEPQASKITYCYLLLTFHSEYVRAPKVVDMSKAALVSKGYEGTS